MAKSKSAGPEFSYGLQRAEVLGALINGVTLLSLCFTLCIDAITRFFNPETIKNPWVVLYVACAGLSVNVIGLFIFHEHSHAHSHSHVHSHKSTGFKTLPEEENGPQVIEIEAPGQLEANVVRVAELIQEQQENHHESHDSDHEHSGHTHAHGTVDLNMHGVWLHVLGDLLASIGVIASALVIIFVKQDWTKYMDPTMSLVLTLVIVKSSIPLCKASAYILLQGAPSSVSVEKLRNEILKIPGVLGIHELHVWQLSDTQTVV
jgi:zinc transporter 1